MKCVAKGNNIGIKYAMNNKADYVLLLNTDTEIEKDAISILVKKAKSDSNVGIVGSRIMYYDNRNLINYYGGKFDWIKGIVIHENYKKEYKAEEKLEKYTDFITGCCMLIKREVIEEVGMLPEEYFMYYEDADYCVKVKEHGYKLAICSNSIIYHKVSSSSGGENSPFCIQWGNRNRLLFMKKYRKYTKGILSKMVYYITRYILYIKYLIKKDEARAKAIKKGMLEGRKYIKENC